MVTMYQVHMVEKLGSQAGTSQCYITKSICTKASGQFKMVTTCRAPFYPTPQKKKAKPRSLAHALTSTESIALLEEKPHKKQEEKGKRK